MTNFSEALAIAIRHLQAGQLLEAQQICGQILGTNPDVASAWEILGLVASQTDGLDAAERHLTRAIELAPQRATAHYNLGNALRLQGKTDHAIACYRQALAIVPDYLEALNNLALALHDLGKSDEAADYYRRALEIKPDYAPAHLGLGTLHQRQNRFDDAAACYRRALEFQPDFVDALNNLGDVLNIQQCFAEAEALLRRAIELQPRLTPAHNNLGNTFQGLGQLENAAICYRQALELAPTYFEAHGNLGWVYQQQNNLDRAIAHYRQALELSGHQASNCEFHAEAVFNNFGTALKEQGIMGEALACFRRAVASKPNHITAHSNLLYSLYFCEGYDTAAIYEEHRRFDQVYARPLAGLIQPHVNDRNPQRRLRIGYVSPDFRHHCQSFFTAPLFAAHDHQQFEIFCYADVARPDGMTHRLASYADCWRKINGLSDQQAAELIRSDQIDILVDLTMHMAHGRPLLFARKPAPVQVCWLAYPGTTGLSAIDYRLTDPHLDPPGLFDNYYSEQSIRLADTFWCYQPFIDDIPVNSPPAFSNRCVTFGCLNNFCKINSSVLALWAQVLKLVDHSRLLLLAPEGSPRQRTLDFLSLQGIDPERIAFVSRQPPREYMALYHHIDVCLDTFPANGHTTSLDSLWMGVPVVTLVGQTAIGRGGLSQLTNLDLPELIAHSPENFMRITSTLAHDLPHLSQLRTTLRERMRSSPLMDAPRFARNIEDTFRQIWKRWCSP